MIPLCLGLPSEVKAYSVYLGRKLKKKIKNQIFSFFEVRK